MLRLEHAFDHSSSGSSTEFDDELDENPVRIHVDEHSDGDFPFHEVTVSPSAFSTYRATLAWIRTRHMRFVPLRRTRVKKRFRGCQREHVTSRSVHLYIVKLFSFPS
jgi:hypothetical protein